MADDEDNMIINDQADFHNVGEKWKVKWIVDLALQFPLAGIPLLSKSRIES